MGKLSEKVAYLQGLSEGMQLEEHTKEGRLITEMLKVMALMADAQDVHDSAIDDLIESVDALNEDLSDMEEFLLDEDDDEDGEDFLAVECPQCHDSIYFDADVLDQEEELTCPSCGAPLSIDQPQEE